MKELCRYIFNINYFSHFQKKKTDFDIEKSILYYKETLGNVFKLGNMKQLLELAIRDICDLYIQITQIFFKFFATYLTNKYGTMQNEEELLQIMEVRYLSPVITREFINYVLKRQINYKAAADEFDKFLSVIPTEIDDMCFDPRFGNPHEAPILFDYEVEKKHGIKIKKGMKNTLSDGRILVTFSEQVDISTIKDLEEDNRNQISASIGDIEDDNVKIVGLSAIICSKNINPDNMYNVVGYITEPIRGKRLTDDVLLSLTNKDFIKVVGYLFSKFPRHYISLPSIFMDNDFVFYIDLFNEDFAIKGISSAERSFEHWIIKHYFFNKGYNLNPNDFITDKESLLKLADSYDAYCDKHDIYYDSKYHDCPMCLKVKYFVPQKCIINKNKIFEDPYAIHYRINSQYNLKFYKSSCVDMHEMEENLDDIIKMNFIKLQMGQDCFVPYKKAFDFNNQFIGYVYDAIQFEYNSNESDINICNDIKNLQTMMNLPRLKSLIRLILQIQGIVTRNLGFTRNPFSHVFLNRDHKKQVQILNIEFLSKKGSIKNTETWTYEYVCDVLASDSSIEIDISDCSKDLRAILTKLQDVAKDMTEYCPIHEMYYKSHLIFCPKCSTERFYIAITNKRIKRIKKSMIEKQELLNEGGESFIYSYNVDSVSKVFREDVNLSFKKSVIAHVLSKREILEEINNRKLKYKYVIPEEILVDKDSNDVFGYTMNKVSGMPLSDLRDTVIVEKLGFTMKDTFEILITVGKGIETLHANNIFIGDLNGRNILFDTNKNVYFLDFDGMGIDGISPEFCTAEYIDPESKKRQKITMQDDYYSFAIQAFHYLTFTHPFSGIYCVKENGRERNLERVERMERKISLLGKYKINPPSIARPWDWMNKELQKSFLSIFEGDSRESIVPKLIQQYEDLYNTKIIQDDKNYQNENLSDTKTSIRINSKFIATEVAPVNLDSLSKPKKEYSDTSGLIPLFFYIESSDLTYDIHCNGKLICDLDHKYDNAKYNAIFDDSTNSWVVINSEGHAAIVNALNGTYRKIRVKVENVNVDTICFENGKIYIPTQDYLHIIKVSDQITAKKMECHGIMTPDSKLYNINTNGFGVMTNNKFYEVRRG